MHQVDELLEHQAGVIARRQLVAAGISAADLRRLVRWRRLRPLHPGVYLNHTGPPSWLQRAWAAVLYADRAALCDQSALRAWDGPASRLASSGPVHVAIDRSRRVRPQPGIVIHRIADLDRKAQWNVGPPRLRIEEAALDVAAGAPDELAAVSALTTAIGSRRTTPARIAAALAGRSRIRRRPFLSAVLRDLDSGTCSVLEQGYLELVERAHCLPTAQRQVVASSRGRIYRDALYQPYGLAIELDGRFDHAGALARDSDLERDLGAAVDGLISVRLGWGQVYLRQCLTAQRIGALLRTRGWRGVLRRCPRCPPG